ncbi:MAG: tyrosine-type recombinase/integrase [Candidatus Omnitrophica bacterium]|nr:tyrosine-type recombinase/integrase [Candidatus Omnitrophota bacterium]
MRQEISEFLGYVGTERGYSPKTVAAYGYDLGKFSQFADKELGDEWKLEDVDQYAIKAYMQFLANTGYRKANETVSRGRKLATLKSFFGHLTSLGKVKSDPTVLVKMPKTKQKEPSYLTEQEYKRLLRTVRKNATAYFKERDMAIVTMLLGMGLRLSELTALDIGDVNFDDGSVKITRKGGKERILPANDEVMISIQRYLKTRESKSPQSPLLLSKRDRRISNASVWHLVGKYMRQAQIEKDKLSPHTLRHTFATILLRQGENILTIKELLSHRNLRTTERYLHINNEDLKNAVGKISLTA